MGRPCCSTKLIYRYAPPATPGLRARWWLAAAGPHLDPLEWAGPADTSGFPLPTAAAPDFDVINNSTNVSDSTSGAARYGIVDGWIFLPDDVTHIREVNQNTGELGMVLIADCCGDLVEQPGGNHTTNTATTDRGLMDSTPISAGWHYVYVPHSDLSAFMGVQIQISVDNEATWVTVPNRQPDPPAVDTREIKSCEPVPDGWQIEPLSVCCNPRYTVAGVTESDVQALIDAQDHDDPQPTTLTPIPDNENDSGIRTGSVGTVPEFALGDHRHPIRRQANPGDPTLTAGGNATIAQSIILDRWSTEETFEYQFRVRVQQPVGTGWGWVNVPLIAGFQQPQIFPSSYRFGSTAIQEDNGDNLGAGPRGPYMGNEVHHWSSTNRVYMGYFRRDDNPWDAYVNIVVRYIRV